MRILSEMQKRAIAVGVALGIALPGFAPVSWGQAPPPPPAYPQQQDPQQNPQQQYPQQQNPQQQYPQQQNPQQQYPQQQYPQQSAPQQQQYPQQPYPTQQPYPPQQSYAPPRSFPPQELDRVVSRIALYPDPLLSQILAAATFPDQIQPAAQWADQHHYLTGPALAAAISSDHLPFDPSVQALLPFPSVLEMMASDMSWTSELGNAFLAQQPDVMDAVQRERHQAYNYGYLRTNQQIVVNPGPYIEILPANPGFIVVPYYNPLVVFAPPRPGFFVGGAIGFGYGITIGAAFGPWGWGSSRVLWGQHAVLINNARWNRTWVNRGAYVHPYAMPRYAGPRPAEQHQLQGRSERERQAARTGREREEEHR